MASSLLAPLLRGSANTLCAVQILATQRIPSILAPLQTPSAFQLRGLSQFILPLAVPTFSNISSFLSGLWDSILRAVPKKRSSYAQKRSRQLAGKALKDITSLNHCSACGRTKRMHILCPYCVQNIKDMWAGRLTKPERGNAEPASTLASKQPRSSSMEVTTKKK